MSYSPYDNIRTTEYPNLLLTGGLNDPRVPYWEPAKFAAKLRGKNRIRKIENSRRYEPIPKALREMTALLILREKALTPILAEAGMSKRGRKPKHQNQTDIHYENIQTEMRSLFQIIGVAV